MTTIKSYTDIDQSRKLAEILSLKSADMCFNTHNNMPPLMTPYSRFEEFYDMGPTPAFLIPCWSLAALLDILPLEVSIGKQTDGVDTYYYIASCDARYCDVYSHRHINVVDACYEMIVKLNELKML